MPTELNAHCQDSRQIDTKLAEDDRGHEISIAVKAAQPIKCSSKLQHTVTSRMAPRSELTNQPGRRNGASLIALRHLATLIVLVLWVAVFISGARAQMPAPYMFVNVHNLTVCQPANITWTGGVPPYRLDIVPFNTTNGTAENLFDMRFIQLTQTFVQYTPNKPPGTTMQLVVTDSSNNADQLKGVRSTMFLILPGPDTSCLTSSSTSPSASAPSTSLNPSPTVASFSSGSAQEPFTPATTQSIPDASSIHHGLSAGAIAGIAVAVGLSALFLTAMAVWCCLRGRNSRKYEKDIRRSLAESTFSNTSTAVGGHGHHPSLSNTIAASGFTMDKDKDKEEFSPTDATYSGPSSPSLDAEEAGLRPIPYLVSQSEASPRTSSADLRKTRKGVVTSITSMSSLATSTTNVSSADGGGGAPMRAIRFETEGGVRFAVDAEGRVVPEEDEDVDETAVSETAGSTLPPPYATYGV